MDKIFTLAEAIGIAVERYSKNTPVTPGELFGAIELIKVSYIKQMVQLEAPPSTFTFNLQDN